MIMNTEGMKNTAVVQLTRHLPPAWRRDTRLATHRHSHDEGEPIVRLCLRGAGGQTPRTSLQHDQQENEPADRVVKRRRRSKERRVPKQREREANVTAIRPAHEH
jgi:hypothetical protein